MDRVAEIISCPVCHSKMFSDMDFCFECFHMMKDVESEGSEEDGEAVQTVIQQPIINYPDTSSVVSIGIEEAVEAAEPRKSEVVSVCCLEGCLFAEFAVELERFLGKFLVDREIDIK